MSEGSHLKAYLLLVATTGCWGLNAIFSKLAVDQITPMQLVTFRWLGVVILMLLFARNKLQRDWPILRHHLPFLCLMGSCGFTAFNALFYVAGHHTSAINIGILQGSIPGPQKRGLVITAPIRPTKKQAKKKFEVLELR